MIEASTTAGTATSSASGGGGAAKKKRRKRGGGSGGSKEPSTPQTSNSSKVLSSGNGRKDASIARTASSGGATRGAKNSKKRRGGRGGEESKRNTSSSSPMQLPHVKVTLRNILDENKHGTVKAIVDSLKIFLDGAFHSSPGTKIDEQNGVFGGNSDKDKFDAYSLACRQEKDQFEREKSMLTYTASSNENTNSSTSASPRPLSFGWVYEVKQTSSQLPSIESVASDVIEKEKSSLSNRKGGSAVNAMVDAAMAQMMLECGKKYLDFVGGKVVLDEDSAVDVMLAEMVQAAKKKMAAIEGQKIDADDGDKNNDGLAEVTELMSNLDTTNPKSNAGKNEPIPAVKIRILSVTPVKKSKRRGIIGGTVNLALYPPDPCMLFKENCRDAGRIAGEKYLMAQERAKEVAAKKSEANNVDGPVPENKREADAASGHSIDETTHTTNTENDSNKAHPIKKMAVPPIPHFPIMTPAERSRAVARSRVLLYRTIRAMKIFAQSKQNHPSDINFHSWDIAESPSQKTWKNRPHPMVTSLLNGVSIDKILAEEQSSIAGSTSSKRWRKGYSGDARADRYDSTIESSDDYKTFMEQWSKDGTIRLEAPADESKDKEKETAKPSAAPSSYAAITSKKEEGKPPQPEFDEEGRPLSAIVMHIRAKQEEAAKAKAEAAAAAARARAAAATMAASKKKKKNDVAVAASSASSSSARKKKRDATKSKKSKSKSTSRAGGESKASTMASPPPGAVFLKKGG